MIVWIVALITVVCAVIGVTTEIFLSRYLVRQVDRQLTEMHDIRQWTRRRPRRRPPAGTSADLRGRQRTVRARAEPRSSLAAVIVDGAVSSSGIVTPTGNDSVSCTPVPSPSEAALAALPTDGRARTVTIDGFGDYRVVASTLPDGSCSGQWPAAGRGQRITGPARHHHGHRHRYRLAGRWFRGLLDRPTISAPAGSGGRRPLARSRTLPLDRGEVDLGVRVPDRDTDTRTEVGQVGAALNQMLGHVSKALVARQASEMRVRQFVADASHELRTPLAAIRGYAELARREEDDTEGVAHALRRVESESARMTTLVDDLLLLARLDSGRPLSEEEVDLTLVVVDAVSDAQVAGPTHRWQLDLPEEPVTTIGDPARLHQVLANLLANARTHTPAGTTVWCGLRTEPGQIGHHGDRQRAGDSGGAAAGDLQPVRPR